MSISGGPASQSPGPDKGPPLSSVEVSLESSGFKGRFLKTWGRVKAYREAHAVQEMAGMVVGFAAVGQVVHLAGVSGGQPIVEPGQAGGRNGRANPALGEAQIGRLPPQFAAQINPMHVAILAICGQPAVESARELINLEDRYDVYRPPISHNSSNWNTPRNDSMNRRFWILFSLTAAIDCLPIVSADAAGKGGFGHKGGFKGGGKGLTSGFGHGGFGGGGCGFGGRGFGSCGIGFGFGGFNDICGYAELYRQLYNNLPYFALHPPVYYSYPVPRTYGYSPFAYPPGTMTPELPAPVKAAEYINPFVPETQAAPAVDRSAKLTAPVRVAKTYINPFVDGAASTHTVAARIEK